ncbi:helix-turn-helix domain-containing protein [Hydrogenophaga sp.]|jgi:hypothetical protein|uniref:helix-turn-helix domain-containing protein n=1 Tax=Hydrogenophaga sp. TaxID=1904254 RepID=UPI0027301A5E|nr:helix-turn-helix domain-containing protein [Hydrogenophaga sp.]MDP2015238.1 helix-turn-helix domain-containing protein [Hydrogenophaga sp.]
MNFFNSEQASTFLGCSVRTIEDLARAGRIFGEKFGESWIYPERLFFESVERIVIEESSARANGKATKSYVPVNVSKGGSLQDLAKRGIELGTPSANDSVARKPGRRSVRTS